MINCICPDFPVHADQRCMQGRGRLQAECIFSLSHALSATTTSTQIPWIGHYWCSWLGAVKFNQRDSSATRNQLEQQRAEDGAFSKRGMKWAEVFIRGRARSKQSSITVRIRHPWLRYKQCNTESNLLHVFYKQLPCNLGQAGIPVHVCHLVKGHRATLSRKVG